MMYHPLMICFLKTHVCDTKFKLHKCMENYAFENESINSESTKFIFKKQDEKKVTAAQQPQRLKLTMWQAAAQTVGVKGRHPKHCQKVHPFKKINYCPTPIFVPSMERTMSVL